MILWSKGLGKLVLNMRLSERSGMKADAPNVVIDGTMGAPTFWSYSVNLDEKDVVEFLELLMQPAPVRFLIGSDQRWSMLGSSLSGIGHFVVRTIYRFLGGRAQPAAQEDQTGSENGRA
ncbi:MAG: hypothetical protein JRH10_08445 [Deltaproteobacteria bacterium]|nr:hypothetical protein [Deltaproteobacteria bacterium]MBW2444349.1 hypothetical protein [Deltaproteobacteria bacterium]